METYEEYKVRHIPENYGGGINILGMHFDIIFLIEGIIMAVLIFIPALYILAVSGIGDLPGIMGLSLSLSGIGLFLGIRGINDEPVTTFISNAMAFSRKRRTAYYNPRVKREAKPFKEMEEERESGILSRENAERIYEKVKDEKRKYEDRKIRQLEEKNAFDRYNMFFEDDEGIIKKPSEYIPESERKKTEKKKKKVKGFLKERRREERYHGR